MLFCLYLGRTEPRGCSVELGLQGSNREPALGLCFLPSNPEVWLFQSSRRLGGKRGSSQGGEKTSPGSINIHRCSLAATAHTKAPLHLQGCHGGSAHCSAKPGKRRRLRPLPAALQGGQVLPQLPRTQPWCPAHLCALPAASPLGDRHWGLCCSSPGGFLCRNQLFMNIYPLQRFTPRSPQDQLQMGRRCPNRWGLYKLSGTANHMQCLLFPHPPRWSIDLDSSEVKNGMWD